MDQERDDKLIMELRDEANDLLACAHLLTALVREKGRDRDAANLAAMNQNLYRLIRTVDHLELCRKAEPVFRPALVDLGSLVRDLGRQVEGVAKELGVSFWWEIDRDGVLALADAALLEQAILNLVANAVQAAGKGGQVTLRCVADKGRWTVTVKDNGPGLTAPEPPEDPFLKGPGGVGLGLEAARRAASVHGGALVLENGEDAGVRAVFSIPVREPEFSEGVRSGSGMRYDRTGGFSPLLVELSPLLPARCYLPENVE